MAVNSFQALGTASRTEQPPNPGCHETVKEDPCENKEGKPAVSTTRIQVVTPCMTFSWKRLQGMPSLAL